MFRATTVALLLIGACASGPVRKGPAFDNLDKPPLPIDAERIEIDLIDRRPVQAAPQEMLPGSDLQGGIRDVQPPLRAELKKELEAGLSPRLTNKPRVLKLQVELLQGTSRLESDVFIEVVEARVSANLKLLGPSDAVLAEGNSQSWASIESKSADQREQELLFRLAMADVIAKFLDQNAVAINTSTTTTTTTTAAL